MRKSEIMRILGALALLVTVTGGPWATPLNAQGAKPLVGSIGPEAFGPPAPGPVPVGGLTTRPLTNTKNLRVRAEHRATDRSHGDGYSRFGYEGTLLHIVDAPYRPYGVASRGDVASDRVELNGRTGGFAGWLPTPAKPQWTRDTTVTPVEAWRDLIVTDVVCNGAGLCVERQQRIRARWIASYGCYAFFDGWNRLWRVE